MITVLERTLTPLEIELATQIAKLIDTVETLEKKTHDLRVECKTRRLEHEAYFKASEEDVEYLGKVARDYREKFESANIEKLRAEQKLADAVKGRNEACDALAAERRERHAEVADVICTERKHTAAAFAQRDAVLKRVDELFETGHILGEACHQLDVKSKVLDIRLAESERIRESWQKYCDEQSALLRKKDELIAHHEKTTKEANERTARAAEVASMYAALAERRNAALKLMGIVTL
jgi:hypothetical protein